MGGPLQRLTIGGTAVGMVPADAPAIASEADVADLVGACLAQGIGWRRCAAIACRQTSSTCAPGWPGRCCRNSPTYRLRLAVIGDISGAMHNSRAFRDLVREAARTGRPLFVRDLDEPADRLARSAPG